MYIETIWIVVLGTSGPVAAVVLFATHLLQVKKLQLEIDKLKAESNERASVLVRASPDEIKRYGQPPSRSKSTPVISTLFAFGVGFLTIPSLIFLWRGEEDRNPELFNSYINRQCVTKYEIELPSNAPDKRTMRVCVYDDGAALLEIEARSIYLPPPKR